MYPKMEKIIRYALIYICVPLFLPLLSSCINEEIIEEVPGHEIYKDKPFVSLRISPMSIGSAVNNGVSEKIRTLRIIMLNESSNESYVELNKLIDFTSGGTFEGSGENAANFSYLFTRATVPGVKKFYIIANEASINSVSFALAEGETLPNGLTEGMSLSDLLNNYTADYVPGLAEILEDNYDGPPSIVFGPRGLEFQKIMNEVYFEANYVINDGTVFLPYTCFYDNLSVGLDDDSSENVSFIDKKMYLVPAATKFDFEFVNYRKANVQIDKFELTNVNNKMFLNAQVGETDQTKNFGGEDMWWIDWLAMCSSESQLAEDTGLFNEMWGWISDYSIPEETPLMKTLSPSNVDNPWIVGALVDKDNPENLHLGPYYYPESINMVTKSVYNPDKNIFEDKEMQAYYLTFYVHEEEVERVFKTDPMEIDTLNALFRATHVVVTVNMYESQVEIYVELAPWVPKQFQGYVEPEED